MHFRGGLPREQLLTQGQLDMWTKGAGDWTTNFTQQQPPHENNPGPRVIANGHLEITPGRRQNFTRHYCQQKVPSGSYRWNGCTCWLIDMVTRGLYSASPISIHSWPARAGGPLQWSPRSEPLALASGGDVGTDVHLLPDSCLCLLS